jgi:2-methylfumaryl-CoA isomerase
MVSDIEQPGVGKVRVAGSPLTFAGLDRGPTAPAPKLGQHTDEVLGDVLGLSEVEIGRLHDDGLVAGADSAA